MNLKSTFELKKKMPPILSLFLYSFVYVEGMSALGVDSWRFAASLTSHYKVTHWLIT